MDAPTRLQQSVQQFQQVVEDLGRRIGEENCSHPDLRTVELAVRESLRLVGQAAMSQLAEAYGTGRSGNRQPCACGSQARFKAVHGRQVTDLYGGVLQLKRAYYFCEACGQGMLPLDRELGRRRWPTSWKRSGSSPRLRAPPASWNRRWACRFPASGSAVAPSA
jgi:hypothetical protein